jgi:hypothetical protein
MKMINNEIEKVLKTICKKLNGVNWALVGSANLALQGVDVRVGDIDILTDKKGALLINRLLKQFRVEEIKYRKSGKFSSYLGKFKIDDVKVEVMGDLSLKNKSGKWVPRDSLLLNKEFIKLGKFKIPTAPLDLELIGYRIIRRYAKVRKIEEVLKKNS